MVLLGVIGTRAGRTVRMAFPPVPIIGSPRMGRTRLPGNIGGARYGLGIRSIGRVTGVFVQTGGLFFSLTVSVVFISKPSSEVVARSVGLLSSGSLHVGKVVSSGGVLPEVRL